MKIPNVTRKLQIIFFPVILAVLLLAGGFGVGLYQASREIRLQKTLTQIQNIFDATRTVFLTQPITPLSLYDLYVLNVLDSKNFDATKTFHPFSHHKDPSAIDFSFAPPDRYAVTFKNLPRKVCFLTAAYPFSAKELYAVSLTHGGATEHFTAPKQNAAASASVAALWQAESFCQNGTHVTWSFNKPVPDDLSAFFDGSEAPELLPQTDAAAENVPVETVPAAPAEIQPFVPVLPPKTQQTPQPAQPVEPLQSAQPAEPPQPVLEPTVLPAVTNSGVSQNGV